MKFYRSTVMHRRHATVRYRFVYRVFNLLLDIDRLDEELAPYRLVSRNRFNLLSFHDGDHGPRDGSPLRPWIDAALTGAGLDLAGGRVRLLCMPRVLGYGFNPLSLWFCQHRDGSLRAVLCEVHNTFGEAHGYLLHEQGRPIDFPVTGRKAKRFHVSPLISMDGEYHFRIGDPDRRAVMGIAEHQAGRVMLSAAWVGEEREARDREFALACLTVPLMTLKVMAMIHWQALSIWLRGARLHRKPAPPGEGIS